MGPVEWIIGLIGFVLLLVGLGLLEGPVERLNERRRDNGR
jgi:uncharacterized membrane protein